MRIRWKLLVLLLGMAVVPLAAVSWFSTRSTRALGALLAERARESLAERARFELSQIVESQGRIIEREIRNMELTLELQAAGAEAALRAAPPAAERVYFSDDFDTPLNSPSDYAPSTSHVRLDPDGTRVPLFVSRAEPVFVLAPGVSRAAVMSDVARLRSIVAELRRVGPIRSHLVQWQFISLASGVHMAYPGHGGYPPGYDGRARPWYKAAAEQAGVVWNPPVIDASTGQAVITGSKAIRGPDGAVVGVTGLDIAAASLYDAVRLPAGWGAATDLYLVQVAKHADTGQGGLRIVAQREFDVQARVWDVPLKDQWLETLDAEEFSRMLGNMAQRQSGVRPMQHAGKECLWAYGALHGDNRYLVIIVPMEALLAEAAAAEGYVLDRTGEQTIVLGSALLTVLAAVACGALIGSRSVTRPIDELAGAAGRIASGDLEARVPVRSKDELGQLARAFNQMVPQLREGIRLRESFALAMQVQQSLLPARAPQVPGFDIAGFSVYCDETGGDYYDFLDFTPMGPAAVDIAVGDVTGHGVAAALLMATARALLRGHALRATGIADLVTQVNRALALDAPLDRFMTLYYARLCARERVLRWASAGHDPAIVYRPAGDTFHSAGGVDLPLGVDVETRYTEFGPLRLEPGDVAVIGTDGIWEARNERGEMFGKDALRETVRASAARAARDIGQAVIQSVAEFRGRRPQQDDITLVVLKVLNGAS